MTEFDDRLRYLVRTIGEAAPQPPPPPDVPVRIRRLQPSGPFIAVVTFVIAVAVFGVVRVFLARGGDGAGPVAGMVTVRHQVLDITLEADLSCDQAMNAGDLGRLHGWSIPPGGHLCRRVCAGPDCSWRCGPPHRDVRHRRPDDRAAEMR